MLFIIRVLLKRFLLNATETHSPLKDCQHSWLRFTPAIPVPKRQRINSDPLLTLLTFVTAGVSTEKLRF